MIRLTRAEPVLSHPDVYVSPHAIARIDPIGSGGCFVYVHGANDPVRVCESGETVAAAVAWALMGRDERAERLRARAERLTRERDEARRVGESRPVGLDVALALVEAAFSRLDEPVDASIAPVLRDVYADPPVAATPADWIEADRRVSAAYFDATARPRRRP